MIGLRLFTDACVVGVVVGQITLIVLKVVGVITLSWFIVLIPVFVYIICAVIEYFHKEINSHFNQAKALIEMLEEQHPGEDITNMLPVFTCNMDRYQDVENA